MNTGQERARQLEYLGPEATVQEIASGWAILLRWGQVQRDLDIAQFWHAASDRWLRVPYGALGKHGWKQVLLTPGMQDVWATDRSMLFQLGPLDALLRELTSRSKGTFSPASWSEWTEAPSTKPEHQDT